MNEYQKFVSDKTRVLVDLMDVGGNGFNQTLIFVPRTTPGLKPIGFTPLP